MSTGNQTTYSADESSHSPKHDCEIMITSETTQSPIEPHLQEANEQSSGLEGNPINCRTSETIPEESACSKCGRRKLECLSIDEVIVLLTFAETKLGSLPDLESLSIDQLIALLRATGEQLDNCADAESLPEYKRICHCKPEQKDETNPDHNLKSYVETLDTEETKSQSLLEIESSIENSNQDRNRPGDFVKENSHNAKSNSASESCIVETEVSKPSTSKESGPERSDHKLSQVNEENILSQADNTLDEIVQMEEGPTTANIASSTTQLVPNRPRRRRRRVEDSDNSENDRNCFDDNFPFFVLAYLLLFPFLVLVALALAYKIWLEGGESVMDRKPSADGE